MLIRFVYFLLLLWEWSHRDISSIFTTNCETRLTSVPRMIPACSMIFLLQTGISRIWAWVCSHKNYKWSCSWRVTLERQLQLKLIIGSQPTTDLQRAYEGWFTLTSNIACILGSLVNTLGTDRWWLALSSFFSSFKIRSLQLIQQLSRNYWTRYCPPFTDASNSVHIHGHW